MFANLNPLELNPAKAVGNVMENVVETVVECVECVPPKTVMDVMDAMESIPGKVMEANPMPNFTKFTDFLTLDFSQFILTILSEIFTSFLTLIEKYVKVVFIL